VLWQVAGVNVERSTMQGVDCLACRAIGLSLGHGVPYDVKFANQHDGRNGSTPRTYALVERSHYFEGRDVGVDVGNGHERSTLDVSC
jgi:hypothetical protein